jgi:DNA repair protein RadC
VDPGVPEGAAWHGRCSTDAVTLEATRVLVLAGDEDGLPTQSLLALLLGSDEAARRLVERFGSLGSVEEATALDLLALPGLGRRRAAAVRAALALGRRRSAEPPYRGRQVGSSRDVYDLAYPLVRHERREVLLVLALDTRNRLLRSPITVAVGSLTQAVVEPRELLRPLILAAAAAAVLVHNHPSTCPEPSPEDAALSRTMFEACALVGVRLLDHVVLGDGAFVSLADRGLL